MGMESSSSIRSRRMVAVRSLGAAIAKLSTCRLSIVRLPLMIPEYRCWSPNWNEPQTDSGTPRFGILTNPYPNRFGESLFRYGDRKTLPIPPLIAFQFPPTSTTKITFILLLWILFILSTYPHV